MSLGRIEIVVYCARIALETLCSGDLWIGGAVDFGIDWFCTWCRYDASVFAAATEVRLPVAARNPTANQLIALLGLEKDHPLVRGLVKAQGMRDFNKGSSGDFSPEGRAYSLMYNDDCIDSVIFTLPRMNDPEDKAFVGELPFGIRRSARLPHSLIECFGKPINQTFDKDSGTWLALNGPNKKDRIYGFI